MVLIRWRIRYKKVQENDISKVSAQTKTVKTALFFVVMTRLLIVPLTNLAFFFKSTQQGVVKTGSSSLNSKMLTTIYITSATDVQLVPFFPYNAQPEVHIPLLLQLQNWHFFFFNFSYKCQKLKELVSRLSVRD